MDLQLFDVGVKRRTFTTATDYDAAKKVNAGTLIHPNALRVGIHIRNNYNTPLYVFFDEQLPRLEADGFLQHDVVVDPGEQFFLYPADFRIMYKGRITYYASNVTSGYVIAGETFIRTDSQQL